MKFNLNGATVEIKVTPEGSKKADPAETNDLANDICLALIHAANFVRGQGIEKRADYYLDIAKSMMENQI